jgi:hypothetical protein
VSCFANAEAMVMAMVMISSRLRPSVYGSGWYALGCAGAGAGG